MKKTNVQALQEVRAAHIQDVNDNVEDLIALLAQHLFSATNGVILGLTVTQTAGQPNKIDVSSGAIHVNGLFAELEGAGSGAITLSTNATYTVAAFYNEVYDTSTSGYVLVDVDTRAEQIQYIPERLFGACQIVAFTGAAPSYLSSGYVTLAEVTVTAGTISLISTTNRDDAIAGGQHVFVNVADAAGVEQFEAGNTDDTIRFAADTANTSVTFDAGTKKITYGLAPTISSSHTFSGGTGAQDKLKINKTNDADRSWLAFSQGDAGANWRVGVVSSPYSLGVFYGAGATAGSPGTAVMYFNTTGNIYLPASGATIFLGDDLNLYRHSAGTLRTDNDFTVAGIARFNSYAIVNYDNGGTDYVVWLGYKDNGSTKSAGIGFGPDTNLYRYDANVLATDDSLRVGGNWIFTAYNLGGSLNGTAVLDTTGASTNAAITINNSSTKILALTAANGNVLIGTTTDDGTNKLQVNGAGIFNGSVIRVNSAASTPVVEWQKAGVVKWQTYVPVGDDSLRFFNTTDQLVLTSGGQLQIPTSGSVGGLLLGSDVNLYRSAANKLKTDDDFAVATKVFVGDVDLGASKLNIYTAASGSPVACQSNGMADGDAIFLANMGGSTVTGSTYAFKAQGSTTGSYIIELQQNTNGNAQLNIVTIGTGDPFILMSTNGGQSYSIGVDNSDSDKFKISNSSALGSNDRFTMDASGNVTIAGTISEGGTLLSAKYAPMPTVTPQSVSWPSGSAVTGMVTNSVQLTSGKKYLITGGLSAIKDASAALVYVYIESSTDNTFGVTNTETVAVSSSAANEYVTVVPNGIVITGGSGKNYVRAKCSTNIGDLTASNLTGAITVVEVPG